MQIRTNIGWRLKTNYSIAALYLKQPMFQCAIKLFYCCWQSDNNQNLWVMHSFSFASISVLSCHYSWKIKLERTSFQAGRGILAPALSIGNCTRRTVSRKNVVSAYLMLHRPSFAFLCVALLLFQNGWLIPLTLQAFALKTQAPWEVGVVFQFFTEVPNRCTGAGFRAGARDKGRFWKDVGISEFR